jgi:uncharacterized protein YjbJ (UPF0337 family)
VVEQHDLNHLVLRSQTRVPTIQHSRATALRIRCGGAQVSLVNHRATANPAIANPDRRRINVSDDFRNKAQELKGKAKENAGDLTDDERLEAEGHADQTKAKFKQAGENVEDAISDARDAARKATDD